MKKIWKEWKWLILSGVVILLLALGIRLYQLTLLPVFADEAIYVRWAQVMRAEPSLRFLPLSDGKQPLFMWAVIPFLKVFSDPLFAGRFVSVLSGLGTLVGIILSSYFLFKSKKVSAVAALIYAISPFSIFFDRMALVDSMLTMFGVSLFFLGLITSRTLRLDLAMITGFFLGGALLTKSPALFFTILLPTTWIFASWGRGKKENLVKLGKLIGLYLVVLVIGYGIYNILRLGPNFNMIASRNADYVFPLSHILTSPKDPFRPFFDRSFEWMRMMGPALVLLLAVFGLFINLKRFPKQTLVLSLWFLFPIAVQSEFAKVFTARYILFSLPFLFILAASVFLIKNENFKKIFVAGLIILIFQAVRFDYFLLTSPEEANLPRSERSGYLEEWTSGYGIKEVGDYIRNEYDKDPNKKIVVGTEGFFGTLPDGLEIYLNDLPKVTVIGVGVIITDLPSSLIDSQKAGNQTYLVINNTRYHGNAENSGLMLLAVYPKGVKPDGSREALLLYQLTDKSITPKPKQK